MSRIGKMLITIPENVKIAMNTIQTQNVIEISGPLGTYTLHLANIETIIIENKTIRVTLNNTTNVLQGTLRSLIEQGIIGVTQGFTSTLELVGVGYKAAVADNRLFLKVGYTHEIVHSIPNGIVIQCIKPTLFVIKGINKQLVNQQAATIRAYKKPEPYKGKGILYENERILRKEGKKK